MGRLIAAALVRRLENTIEIEFILSALIRFLVEEYLNHFLHVRLKFLLFFAGIPFGNKSDIDLVMRVTTFHKFEDLDSLLQWFFDDANI